MGPLCGYSDLLRLQSLDPVVAAGAAELMGFHSGTPRLHHEQPDTAGDSTEVLEVILPPRTVPPTSEGWPTHSQPATFWQPTRYWAFESTAAVTVVPDQIVERSWKEPGVTLPGRQPIATWQQLVPRVRKALQQGTFGSKVDVARLVGKVARGELVSRLPREPLRRWGSRLQLVIDRSQHLTPFYDDQRDFRSQMERIYGEENVDVAYFDESRNRLVARARSHSDGSYVFPSAGTYIIVLSDFGCLLNDPAGSVQFWRGWLRKIVDQKSAAIAVVPCDPHRIERSIRSAVKVVSWQAPTNYTRFRHQATRDQCVEFMLAALCCTAVVEPGLLRAIRWEVFGFADASLESDFWMNGNLRSRHLSGAMLDSVSADEFSKAFSKLAPAQKELALRVIRDWRHGLSDEVWIGEIWRLTEEARKLVPEADVEIATERAVVLTSQMTTTARPGVDERAWLARVLDSVPQHVLAENRMIRDLHRLAHPEMLDQLLAGSHPSEVAGGESETVHLRQVGSRFDLERANSSSASAIASLHTTNGWVTFTPQPFWKSGQPPEWASAWDHDKFGKWVEFQIPGDAGPITQRMRWISRGKFRRGEEENKPHMVHLSSGFWLMDTTVTQELWQAVMGTDPSHSKGPRRPVDSVSWNDAREFITRLNEQLGDAVFSLPTEAQWEYACRAGTTTAFAFGEELTKEQARVESSEGTIDVASFARNGWGLFDMHGNVWEWCEDWHGDYQTSDSQVDPFGPAKGRYRVVRGGSWRSTAQVARSAYRNGLGPGYRGSLIGFRCAQVQESAEPCEEEAGRQAERRLRPTSGGGAVAIRVVGDSGAKTSIPSSGVVVVETDLETLELRKVPKPEWASAMGRDQFGLWVEFEVHVASRRTETRGFLERARALFRRQTEELPIPEKVTQRMRWIPPGQFRMGADGPQASDDESPVHDVTLTHGYWMFETQVTQELWLAVTGETPSHFTGARRPVEKVSWEESRTFCKQLNDAVDGLQVCLPTEAEWENACRAGTTTEFAFGDQLGSDQAHFDQDFRSGETKEVASFSPNAWGLFDMHGNVWEWCEDWRGDYASVPQTNPPGPEEGLSRVFRGGSWDITARLARSASRLGSDPGYRHRCIGFRCAQVQEASRERGEQV